MYTDLIYDFDGTLFDTYPVFTEALLTFLGRHGIVSDYETAYKRLKVTVGYALRSYGFDGDSFKPANKEFKSIYWELAKTKQKPLPYVIEVLDYAVNCGKRNYIYTRSGKEVLELLEKWGMTDKFTYVIDASMPFPTKPDPAALNWLCEEFGLDKSKCLMIGDRDLDTECGTNAGMKNVLFDVEGYYADCPCDYKIDSFKELEEIMDGKRG